VTSDNKGVAKNSGLRASYLHIEQHYNFTHSNRAICTCKSFTSRIRTRLLMFLLSVEVCGSRKWWKLPRSETNLGPNISLWTLRTLYIESIAFGGLAEDLNISILEKM